MSYENKQVLPLGLKETKKLYEMYKITRGSSIVCVCLPRNNLTAERTGCELSSKVFIASSEWALSGLEKGPDQAHSREEMTTGMGELTVWQMSQGPGADIES